VSLGKLLNLFDFWFSDMKNDSDNLYFLELSLMSVTNEQPVPGHTAWHNQVPGNASPSIFLLSWALNAQAHSPQA
jgi:hypothetical protein